MAKSTYEDEKVKDMTGPERNIGARLNRQDYVDNLVAKDWANTRHAELFNPSVDDVKDEDDASEKALNTAKAKSQKNAGPNMGKVNKSTDTKKALKPFNMAKGGKVSSASKRADGCAQRGKTRGKIV